MDSDWSAIKQKLGSERGAFGQLDALVGRPPLIICDSPGAKTYIDTVKGELEKYKVLAN